MYSIISVFVWKDQQDSEKTFQGTNLKLFHKHINTSDLQERLIFLTTLGGDFGTLPWTYQVNLERANRSYEG